MWIDKNGNPSKGWIILEVPVEHENKKEDGTTEIITVPTMMRIFNPSDEQYTAAGFTKKDPTPPQPDPGYERRYQEYLAACGQFRMVCGMIKEFAGLDEFTGGFDEAMEFIQSAPFMANIVQGTYLFSLWQGADKAATYTADKIGLGQPDWWCDCWRQVSDSESDTTDSGDDEDITSDTQQVEEQGK